MSTTRSLPEKYDVVVVGAGVIGPVVAVAFANQGRKVAIVERDWKQPDRIVGELLQPGGVKALEKVGMEKALEGIDGQPVYGYQILYHGKSVNIPYPLKNGSQKEREKGVSFHHGAFISNLRKYCVEHPHITPIEATVTKAIKDPINDTIIGVECSSSNEKEKKRFTVKADLTVMCDGIFSKFRKQYLPKTPKVGSHFVALQLTDADMPAPYHGHVILSDEAPVLVYQISKHDTRILCSIRSEKLPSQSSGELKKYLETSVLPNLPAQLQSSFSKAVDENKYRSMPNSFLPAVCNKTPGMLFIGDSLNMRHPLTGGGMTVAFNDAVTVTTLLREIPNFSNTDLVLSTLQTFHWERKKYASVINILSFALFALFAADDPYLEILQKGCFKYFQLGGECINGPVSLLSGVLQSPSSLVYHFFSVAFYSIYLNFAEKGILGFPLAFFQMFMTLYTACYVIFPYIWSEF